MSHPTKFDREAYKIELQKYSISELQITIVSLQDQIAWCTESTHAGLITEYEEKLKYVAYELAERELLTPENNRIESNRITDKRIYKE